MVPRSKMERYTFEISSKTIRLAKFHSTQLGSRGHSEVYRNAIRSFETGHLEMKPMLRRCSLQKVNVLLTRGIADILFLKARDMNVSPNRLLNHIVRKDAERGIKAFKIY